MTRSPPTDRSRSQRQVVRATQRTIPMHEVTSRKALLQDATQSEQEPVKKRTLNSSPLNFKVPEEFRREFKTYAAQHNMKLNELLFHAFSTLKKQDSE